MDCPNPDQPAKNALTPKSKARRIPGHPQTARALAFQILARARSRSQKEHKSLTELLSESLQQARLSRRDEALATELVYSTFRRRLTLDWLIEKASNVPPSRIEPLLLDVLRLGVLQLLYLGGVPTYAAVDESVKLARNVMGRKAAGFANSVLRKIAESASSLPFPQSESDPVKHISIVHSHPQWLVRRWLQRLGEQTTVSVCIADNAPPPITARGNILKVSREKLMEIMAAEGVEVLPGKLDETVEIVSSSRRIAELTSFRQGLFYLQDISATIPTRMLEPLEGDNVLDLCTAPGGKATHIAELMGNKGLVVACDIDQRKMPLLQQNVHRLATSIVRPMVADGTRIAETLKPVFDRVLIDAPCSNTGVLRRRPEARWRLNHREIKKLHQLQLNLLLSASRLLKPNGTLIYSTCSIEPEENEEIIREFLVQSGDFALEDEKAFLPEVGGGDGGYVAKLVKK